MTSKLGEIMTHALGVYYAPTHGREADRQYIAALQPPVIRLFDNPDVQQIVDAHALAPGAIIAPRTWAIDDSNGDAVRRLMADPVGTGRDHAQQYRGQLDRWQREAQERGLRIPSADRIYFNSANEPNQGGTPDKIAAYSIAFLDRCTELGLRAGAPCLGVGWPGNDGPDTPVDWSPYAGLEQAIRRGRHWLILHEYFYKSGPQDGWRWLAGRHLQCPFDVPIVLGEIGIDNYVDAERWRQEGGNRGWQGNVDAETYAGMIEYHVRGSSTRVVAVLPFITDYRSRMWESFDTGPAHNTLLARKDRMIPQNNPIPATQPPVTVYAPIVATVTGGGSVTSPVDNFARAIEFVLRWEGGLSTDPNDPGNYRDGVFVGTKYGISAAAHPGVDIVNLTREQAIEIYRQQYWIPSKADKLPWPDCLAVFDLAVNGGVGRALQFASEVGTKFLPFMARRLEWYSRLDQFSRYGSAWVRRCADLMREATK